MPKGRQDQQRRFCAFCGGVGLSREHFWPEWMHSYLPNGPAQSRHVERLETYEGKRVLVDVPRDVERQGGTRNKTMKIVCRTCNGGWMSELENAAKPIMIPMMQGERVVLDAAARLTLAQWIALKAMLADANVPGDTVLSAQQRLAFKNRREIPPSFSANIGRTTGMLWSTRFHRHAAIMATSVNAKVPASGKNVQAIVFGANQLLMAVFIDESGVGLSVGNRFLSKVPRLFPLDAADLVWPPATLLDVEAVMLATALDELIQSPRVRWMQTPPGTDN